MVAVDVGAAPKKLKVLALNPKVTCPGLVAVKVAVARGVGEWKNSPQVPPAAALSPGGACSQLLVEVLSLGKEIS